MNYEIINCELLSICEIVNAKGNKPRAGTACDSGRASRAGPARKSAHRAVPGQARGPVRHGPGGTACHAGPLAIGPCWHGPMPCWAGQPERPSLPNEQGTNKNSGHKRVECLAGCFRFLL